MKERIAIPRAGALLAVLALVCAGCIKNGKSDGLMPPERRVGFGPRDIALSAMPLRMAELKPITPLFVPAFELFEGPEGVWGPDKRFGGLWVHNLVDFTALDGMAAVPGKGIAVVETPNKDGYAHVLRWIDTAGRTLSTHPFTGRISSLEAGKLGGRQVLLTQDWSQTRILDRDGSPVLDGVPSADNAALADLDGDGRGELVLGDHETITALSSTGKTLWRREGLSHVDGLAAGSLGTGRGDGLAVFVSSPGSPVVLILDGKGRDVLEFRDDSFPQQGVFLRAEGKASYLAHVGSRYQSRYARLRVSRIEGGTRTITAEADLGPVHVVKMIGADLIGDKRKEIVLGTENGWIFIFDEEGRRLGEKHHFGEVRHLAAADLDADGRQELLIGVKGTTSHLYAYGVVPSPLPKPARAPDKP